MLGDPVQFNHVEFEIVNQSLEQAIVVIKYILIVDDDMRVNHSDVTTSAQKWP